jgi:exonuclease VII small subunit
MSVKEHFESYIKFPIVNPKVNKYIENFVTENIDVLGSIGVDQKLVFGDERKKRFLDLYGFDERSFKRFMRGNKVIKSNFKHSRKPEYLLPVTSYALASKKIKDNFLYFLSIMIYTNKHQKYFEYGVNQERMEYTISKLSNRYLLKKNGTILKTLQETTDTIKNARIGSKTFKERIKRLNDEDYLQIVNRFDTSINLMMKNIANEYYENDTVVWKDEEILDRENLRTTTNDSLKFENVKTNLSDKTIKYGLDTSILKETNGMKYSKQMKELLNNHSKEISDLYEMILDDYMKNTAVPGIEYAKRYGFVKYYKNSRKKDKNIKRKIEKLMNKVDDINRYKFSKVLNRYLVASIHKELQNV